MSPTDRPRIPSVIWEDNHLIAFDKPAGMPTQSDISGDESLFDWGKEYIRVTYNKPGNVYLGLLHRLDRPTGGIVLMAKTSKAASRMTDKFKKRKVDKTYLAIVHGLPRDPEGRLQHYLGKVPGQTNIMRAYHKPGEGHKEAVLEYQLLGHADGFALLEVQLLTGRKHQIRVQLAAIGNAVAGDMKYARVNPLPDRSIGLFARRLQFTHPVGEPVPIDLIANPPQGAPWDAFRARGLFD